MSKLESREAGTELEELGDLPLTTGRAAAVVGVTPQTLRRMEERGKITAKRGPNGERRFSTHDCLRLAASGEEEIYRSSVENPLSLQAVVDQYRERLDEEERYMTADEAVIALGASRATLRRWELQGKISSKRSQFTKHVLFLRQDVKDLIARRMFS